MPESKDPWLVTPEQSAIGNLNLAGSLTDTPGIRSDSMRILGSFALVLITGGEGYYSDENGWNASIHAGDALLVFPEIAHAYGQRHGASWSQSYVVFEGPAFELMRQQGVLAPSRPIWHLEPVDYWKRRLEELFHDPVARRPGAALKTVGRFLALLTDMAAADQEQFKPDGHEWFDASAQLLSQPQADGWLTPQEVAPLVGLSYENFRKLFARQAGEPPAQFQKRRRIERACAAIYQGTSSFKELAEQLGFCDAYHFSRVFRQVMKETPTAFRRRVRGR